MMAPPPGTFCESLATVLHLLTGGGVGTIAVDARSYDGIAHNRFGARVSRPFDPAKLHLPHVLLSLLESSRLEWQIQAAAAVEGEGGASQMHCVVGRWRFSPTFSERRFVIPEGQVAAAATRLRQFPLQPTAVVDAVSQLVALWSLRTPLDLSSKAGTDRAVDLQRSVNEALGAACEEDPVSTLAAYHPSAFYPIGGFVRDMGTSDLPSRLISVVEFAPALVYTVDDIEAALSAPREAA